MLAVVRGRPIERARLIVLHGVLSALGLTLAATLLRLVSVQTWPEIGAFAVVFALRTLIKTVFLREQVWLTTREH